MQREDILAFFAAYIENELGIVYAEHNYFQLQNRLEEIARLQGLPGVDALYELAQSKIDGAFRQLLIDTATNNETSFFRDPKVFRGIEKLVLDPILAKGSAAELVIWSAAASSGQEAISVAIMITEWCARNNKKIPFRIIATDISERILKKAKAGCYTQLEVQRGLPAPLLIKYFKKDANDNWTVSPEILKQIEYRSQNIKEHFHFTQKFNVVLCRNILIYQNVERKIDIIRRVRATMCDDAFLVLGAGESLIGLSDDFSNASAEGAVIYKLKPADIADIRQVA